MKLRRKTKKLSGLSFVVYLVFFLLLSATYFTYSHFVKNEEKVVITPINPKASEEIKIEEDTVSKPDVYIPDANIVAVDTVRPAKAILKEQPETKQTVDKKEKIAVAEIIPKKTEDVKDKPTTIGKDRSLTAYIPGTMGKVGKLPSHNCKVKGELVMSYMVDKNGSVTSAGRSSGINNPCATTAAVIWLKQYVKAKKSNTISKGTYTIKF